MRIIHNLKEMTETARGWLAGGSVGFISTMGYLHDGHMALVQTAKRECEICVVSIFVNPLQFATEALFAAYPRDLARDLQLLTAANVDIVFVPSVEEIFPPLFATYVTPSGLLATQLEASRNSNYARGISTVLTKLLQLVRPDVAYFGQKDPQRVAIVRQIVRDLNIDVNLRILPVIREANGLPLSSRNASMTATEGEAGAALYRSLLTGKVLIENGERRAFAIEQAIHDQLASIPSLTIEYIEICHHDTFTKVDMVIPRTMFIASANIGDVHLVDSITWFGDDHWQL
jgi:pantoate--beta-alanine ligase